ncbi:hypothetical protein [Rhodococcus rhodochrous]|uniref:hypothetical protein n=1 Tax=Rhodococcus rhodochrous TaxID=1829 RepID=UPI00188A5CD5|nr:hypothetical protein [Rhodococcus rhodochrous]MBF4480159.1 hypothetical protein [Rhodococcus rhodochrous]
MFSAVFVPFHGNGARRGTARSFGERSADTTAILNDLEEMYRRHDNSHDGRVRVCASPSTPSSSIPAMLAWQASGRDVRTVLIDGRVVMRDGLVDWLDGNAEADLLNTASERAEKIAARADIATTRRWESRAFRSHEQCS